jgi:hypothetical protein
LLKTHTSLSKNDQRGRIARDKLWENIKKDFNNKYSGKTMKYS